MKIHLRDRNAGMVHAWEQAFEGTDVEATVGDIFDGTSADAIVSPANSFGFMDGGIDGVYTNYFGSGLQKRLQDILVKYHHGELPVGQTQLVSIPEGESKGFKYMICAPTMRVPSVIDQSVNAYLAFRATLRLVQTHNRAISSALEKGLEDKLNGARLIESILCPGLGTAVGKMPHDRCAKQMRLAYDVVVRKMPNKFPHLSFAAQNDHGLRGLV